MQRKLEIREQELKRAQSRDNTVQNHLNALNDKLKAADKKVQNHYKDVLVVRIGFLCLLKKGL